MPCTGDSYSSHSPREERIRRCSLSGNIRHCHSIVHLFRCTGTNRYIPSPLDRRRKLRSTCRWLHFCSKVCLDSRVLLLGSSLDPLYELLINALDDSFIEGTYTSTLASPDYRMLTGAAETMNRLRRVRREKECVSQWHLRI